MMNGSGERLNKFSIWDLLILLLIIGVLLSNYIWLKIDRGPVEGHELIGIIPAVQVYKELKGIENTHTLYDQILGRYYGFLAYPPLSYLIIALFYFLFGLQGQMVVMVNSLYIILALLFVYLIGKEIFNERIGLLAAFILSSFPGFIGFSHIYWIEFGLMGYVCLDLYLLLKTNFFEDRKYSILLGISLALSFLHKHEFIVFIIGPLLLVIYKSGVLKDVLKTRWSKRATNLTLALGLGLLLTSFWWIRYGRDILERMFFTSRYSDDQMIDKTPYLKDILSFKSLTYYLRSIIFIIGYFFLFFFFLSFIILILRSITKKEKKFYALYLMLCFIIPYFIFTSVREKFTSHIFSLFPSIAILISASTYFLKNKIFRIVLINIIIIYGIILHLLIFYIEKANAPAPVKFLKKGIYSSLQIIPSSDVYFSILFCCPRKERIEFAIEEILKYIDADSYKKNCLEKRVVVVYEKYTLQNCIFEYYSLIRDYKIRFFPAYRQISDLSECDYVIIEKFEGESIEEILSRGYHLGDIERANFKKIFKEGIKDFELIKIYKIPNGDVSAFIYKRKNKPT